MISLSTTDATCLKALGKIQAAIKIESERQRVFHSIISLIASSPLRCSVNSLHSVHNTYQPSLKSCILPQWSLTLSSAKNRLNFSCLNTFAYTIIGPPRRPSDLSSHMFDKFLLTVQISIQMCLLWQAFPDFLCLTGISALPRPHAPMTPYKTLNCCSYSTVPMCG